MKTPMYAYVTMAVALIFMINRVRCEPVKEEMKKKQQATGRMYEIDNEIEHNLQALSSPEEKVAYLKSYLIGRHKSSQQQEFQKSSAIRLLGEYGGTNAIPALIDNLEYEDPIYRDNPSVTALVAVGESATEPLLDVIKSKDEKQRIALAVQALMRIKGTNYNTFIECQRDQMPSNTWKNLLRYAIED